jgi:predicted Ser/Thr protein kinase
MDPGDIFSLHADLGERTREVEMSLAKYLEACRNDPGCYASSAPIKMLHPLLTATQESNYLGTENIGAIPFQGILLAHSDEAEWQNFRNNRTNEAFLDRVSVVKVPYCLRVTEESRIYEKLINGSALAAVPCAPHTLEAGPLRGTDPAQAAREFAPLRQGAGL